MTDDRFKLRNVIIALGPKPHRGHDAQQQTALPPNALASNIFLCKTSQLKCLDEFQPPPQLLASLKDQVEDLLEAIEKLPDPE